MIRPPHPAVPHAAPRLRPNPRPPPHPNRAAPYCCAPAQKPAPRPVVAPIPMGPVPSPRGIIVSSLCKIRGCIPLARNRIRCDAGKEKQTGRHIRRRPETSATCCTHRFSGREDIRRRLRAAKSLPQATPWKRKSATLETFPGQRQRGLHAKGLPAEKRCAASRPTTRERTPHRRGGISTCAATDRAPRTSW